ncbi:unnamed protein product [Vitrella brassicaformis CCMP3155]|uniref:Secreted protein n=1 Tax=Vitrella brassicaformis (strain CCMP3155) TaxID=1169540 RepID=A0A0G4FM67_VITBC|nr:unnamed protein product [Vitrella brassicaformis CCMP3155]|eukprot:CEM14934.1 unnamed protein product [Vitrella brassicaformis CCMP3155]
MRVRWGSSLIGLAVSLGVRMTVAEVVKPSEDFSCHDCTAHADLRLVKPGAQADIASKCFSPAPPSFLESSSLESSVIPHTGPSHTRRRKKHDAGSFSHAAHKRSLDATVG